MVEKHEIVEDDLVIVFGPYAGQGFNRLNEIAKFLQDNSICAYTVEGYFRAHPGVLRTNPLVDSRSFVDICDLAIFVFFDPITINVSDPRVLVSFDHGQLIELAHLDESGREIPVQFIFDTQDRRDIMSSLLSYLLRGWLSKSFVDEKIVKTANANVVIEEMKTSARGFCWSVLLEI